MWLQWFLSTVTLSCSASLTALSPKTNLWAVKAFLPTFINCVLRSIVFCSYIMCRWLMSSASQGYQGKRMLWVHRDCLLCTSSQRRGILQLELRLMTIFIVYKSAEHDRAGQKIVKNHNFQIWHFEMIFSFVHKQFKIHRYIDRYNVFSLDIHAYKKICTPFLYIFLHFQPMN